MGDYGARRVSYSSEHMALVNALADMENRFRVFSETSVQGKLVLSAFRPLFANAVAARILGYQRPEDILRRLSVLNHFGEDVRRDPDGAERMARAGHYEGRAQWTRRDGATIDVALASRPIQWLGADAIMVAFTDISAQVAAERMAQEAQMRAQSTLQARRAMLASVSHNLRTPLHAMMGRLGLMVSEDLPPKARRLIQDAILDARRLLVQIDDLLDEAAVATRAPHLRTEVFDLADALDDALQICASGLPASATGVRVLAPITGQVHVTGDRRRLTRIALAMLEAGLARCRPQDLTISAACEPQAVNLEVWGQRGEPSDLGIGQQASDGLKLAAAMAQAMGGALKIERTGETGYRLHACLPFPTARPESRRGDTQADGLRVLAADDHAGNRQLIRLVLEALGCTVETVDSGEAALARLANATFDIVLIDIMMPGLNGIETAKRIRAGPASMCETPIVALTADVSDETRQAAEAAGMDAVLTKPIEPRILAEVLAMLSSSQACGD